ncbi:MAG: GntR family transcriptional regulator, partial [Candidatus Aminicenantes bacterium]|nr:GntR family transcriptional regulator [Candidatus Aminicenantes bacterium]NIQ71706.1 GntR family transcriptional regulator [Candidatus Aminicenantes bacterium]NIT27740.1 GntR family transcriptional regulator [Candidatus Aminicenantes bacterium]
IEFKLDLKSGVPFHRQIVDQIRYGIASDRLMPGEQLPTVRQLAVHLQIST